MNDCHYNCFYCFLQYTNDGWINVRAICILNSKMSTTQQEEPTIFKNVNISFDTNTALAGLYLWLLFSYLGSMISCDVQKMMENNIFFKHFVGIVAFYLLFTMTNTSNNHQLSVWVKTLWVYVIFLAMIKSKWYFSFPVLVLLVVDQSLKAQISHLTNNDNDIHHNTNQQIENYTLVKKIVNVCMLSLIAIGFIAYTLTQFADKGDAFSWSRFLFHYSCTKTTNDTYK